MASASNELQTSPEPIYDASRQCSTLLNEYMIDEAISSELYTTIQELRGRFEAWAAYTGAFALPRASLDARLAPHDDIKNMVLDLLTMLERNLQWGMCPLQMQMPRSTESHI